ncbi:MAG: peptide chain release factor 1 [Planctomycetota bacterium]
MLNERLRNVLMERLARLETLEGKVSDPVIAASGHAYAEILRERGSLAKELAPFQRLLALEEERAENETALSDAELCGLAQEEIARLDAEIDALAREIADAHSGARRDENRNVILEIRAGTGGDEAALFAGDLFRMYQRYAEKQGWTVEAVSASPSEAGGFKEIVVGLQGDGVFRDLRLEGGGHRVQRVPATESQGRIHTSAATVAVLPEAEEYEVEMKPDELRIEVCRAQGPGGQYVNKTESAVRITHLPTGITVVMQDEKSQHKNKAKALRILRSRVYDHYTALREAERAASRRSQTRSGDRAARIRTYNITQNRVTDHRLGKNFSLDRVLAGDLDGLVRGLVEWARQEELGAP